MLQGYFDESGGFDQEPKIFGLSGYLIDSEAAVVMDAEWGRVLNEYDIPYFHMVDCAHGAGIFSGMTKATRSQIVEKFIGLIKKNTLQGFSALVNGNVFESSVDAYSECASMAVSALEVFLDASRAKDDIAYIFESGHKSQGSAYNHVAEKLAALSASLTFARKESVRLLQAADLLAWQSTKYAKDAHTGKRAPRKDFLSLMEHRHHFFFVSIRDKQKTMAIELWPLSERSKDTVALALSGGDGPIPFSVEDGEGVPIVMVNSTVGSRMGAGRMAYVGFTALGAMGVKKPLYLCFDEMRLVEAIHMLVGATGIYGDGDMIPAMSAKAISFHKDGQNDIAMRVQLTDKARLVFRIPKEVFDKGFGVRNGDKS
jgi:hypothetical protein